MPGLGLFEAEPTVLALAHHVFDHRAPDLGHARVQIDVAPAKRKDLSEACSCGERQEGGEFGRCIDECLNKEDFWSIEHARVLLERFRVEYNTEHLHSSLGYLTPVEFAATCPVGAA